MWKFNICSQVLHIDILFMFLIFDNIVRVGEFSGKSRQCLEAKMLPIERRQQLLTWLKLKGALSISVISTRLQVLRNDGLPGYKAIEEVLD